MEYAQLVISLYLFPQESSSGCPAASTRTQRRKRRNAAAPKASRMVRNSADLVVTMDMDLLYLISWSYNRIVIVIVSEKIDEKQYPLVI